MARRLRLCIPDVPMHIVHRGTNRARVFHTDQDHWFYLYQLAELAPRSACVVHAYVLMPNHVHLLMTPRRKDSPSVLMKHLAQRHAQFINRVHRRTGAFWEGRFYSSLVECGSHLFNCYRYIELNPVRARLAQHPSEYAWSSYRINAEGRPSSLVKPHAEFTRLGDTDDIRRSAYRALFGHALDDEEMEEIRRAARGGAALGSDQFRQRWERQRWGQTPN
jgi:putative transposase